MFKKICCLILILFFAKVLNKILVPITFQIHLDYAYFTCKEIPCDQECSPSLMQRGLKIISHILKTFPGICCKPCFSSELSL